MAGIGGTVAPDSGGGIGASGATRALVWLLVTLFFLWGAITSLNDILVPKLKGLFQLGYAQVMLTQSAFFLAYLVVSLPAGMLIARIGYMRGIVAGLGIMAAGCLLFVPAAHSATFATFLGALFVLAGGITILQVAANPLIANLGDARHASSRLTLAQAFNSLGTTIAPAVGASIILGSIGGTDPASLSGPARDAFLVREAAVIGHTYVGLAVALVLIAGVFWWRRHALRDAGAPFAGIGLGLLGQERQLAFGVLAIFLYVGAEVAIGSMLANWMMLPGTMALDQQSAGAHISFYWGGAMVGRFVGSALLRMVPPGKLLAGNAICAVVLIALAASVHGPIAGWLLIAVGLANSIMFPTIFALGVAGLGERTAQGSGLLCMAIVGGAVIPPLLGVVADASSLSVALVVPALCYLGIAGFGWTARRI